MRATFIAAIAWIAMGVVLPHPARSQPLRVSAVRVWSLEGVTRVIVEASGEFEHHSERLHNPERVFFDIFRARPLIDGKRVFNREIGDRLVSRVRVAETLPGVTRVVLDLASNVEYSATRIGNPSRLVIELRPGAAEPAAVSSQPASKPPVATAPPALPPAAPTETKAAASKPPTATAPAATAPPAPPPATPTETNSLAAAAKAPAASAAARKSDGKNSLIRALGLKMQRIVIDPGHGGHDQGTVGRRGLVEKELVLDIAKRVGRLLEQEIGCEVVYTREDDSFVPLEDRTALANAKKGDLFVSLHANSSKYPRISGVETFYLNFTDSRDAMEVAARENAGSDKNISELQNLLQKIARQEKIDESRELAGYVQSSLFTLSSKHNRGSRNRGVKKAPFIVLIGAQMPSVLVEIGFLSNAREEMLLKRPDHRQRVAEALVRGISRYAQSLSHFQLANAREE